MIRVNCPRCNSNRISHERRLNGDVRCLQCGYKATHAEWNGDDDIKKFRDRIAELEAGNIRLREALEYYAGADTMCEVDGSVAKKALGVKE